MQEHSYQAAAGFLSDVLNDAKGVGVLLGPEAMTLGSRLVDDFVEQRRAKLAVADIDGSGLHAQEFLSKIIEGFGYDVVLDSTDELLNMLRVIIVQQTRVRGAPLLIVRNINRMYPSALCTLCKLAAQRAGNRYAVRIILIGEDYFPRIMGAPAMAPISRRVVGRFELRYETPSPVFVLTHAGKVVREFELSDSRVLIGRSAFCDIRIDSQSVSRQHAMLIKSKSSVAVIDLRSHNGTFVNAQPVDRYLLRDSDIVEIGNYRLKAYLPDEFMPARGEAFATDDTARMKTIEDAREAKRKGDSSKVRQM